LDLALAQLEERKKKTEDPPGFVKAKVSKPKKEGPRKKRKPEHNGARKRESPTQIEDYFVHICPDCQGNLSGISLSRRHKSKSRNTGSTKDAVAAARSGTKPHLNCQKAW